MRLPNSSFILFRINGAIFGTLRAATRSGLAVKYAKVTENSLFFYPEIPKNTDFMQETDITDPFKGIGQSS